MGNETSAPNGEDPLTAEMANEPMLDADGTCQHINRAITILLTDKTIPNRSMINKSQCICYYCNPLSRLVFCRGGRKDILANKCVKLAFNFNLKEGEKSTPQQITNSYRRLFYGTDSTTMQRVLASRRFYSRATKFVSDDTGNLVEDINEQLARPPYDRLNYASGLLEKFTQNQVFFSPEPELALQYGSHPYGRICLQVLFDNYFTFSKVLIHVWTV
jgi:hypothetical protein